jgi:hypothetical protein
MKTWDLLGRRDGDVPRDFIVIVKASGGETDTIIPRGRHGIMIMSAIRPTRQGEGKVL